MVISAETTPRRPDTAVASSAAATEATPPRGEAQGSFLHHFSFPILNTWGNHRALRCMSVNGKEEIVAGDGRGSIASPVEAPESWIRASETGPGDDPRIEEVREKLMAHLREAADRMNLVVQLLPKGGGDEAEPAPEARLDPQADVSAVPAALPWNLRTRRGAVRAPMEIQRHLSVRPQAVCRRSEDAERRERPKFSISLAREEIEEDIYSMTGCRPPRRPRKRAKVIQKQLDSLFPGSWLSYITPDSYRLPD
ncbi:hypothetical protein OPV22_026709 [Ensete ventricosum]|uniref:DUF3741 domain-containing protein n=1 Tax=Ensete ventricosum TaxID=4639 RepID=A0AAV8P4M9_ENSVE|nr:hypothetical protein OPV22_034904 [Ensete ventricosum]KAJ8464157.1 hypothetical protein OPV22_026709 [Ensete ventricosum]